MSRRGIIAALAGAVAVNVPVIAVTAAALPAASAASPAGHPDQALLDLGRQYEAALGAEDAACEAWTEVSIKAREARPAMPDILRHRIDDHWAFQFPLLGETSRVCDNDLSDFYNGAEIEYLRAMHHRTDGGRVRAAQVIDAWDRHHETCLALSTTLGCDDAKAAYQNAVRARQAIARAIVDARATTLAGLAVRAGIIAGLAGDDDDEDEGGHLPTDQKMIAAIVRDLVAIAV